MAASLLRVNCDVRIINRIFSVAMVSFDGGLRRGLRYQLVYSLSSYV